MNSGYNMTRMQQAVKLMNQLGRHQRPFLFIIDFDMQRPVVKELPLTNKAILYDIRGITNSDHHNLRHKEVTFSKRVVSFEQYKLAFDQVLLHIHQGNSYLVNLTQPSQVEVNISMEDIFHYSKANYKLFVQNQFVVFSPETFIVIRDNKIKSFPMKGTIDAALPAAEYRLLTDPKEMAEHMTMVDLIRNDLSAFAKNVHVSRLKYLDYLTTNQGNLWQMSSEITGDLPEDYPNFIGEILLQLLPAGSISGAPKTKTVEIIKKTENYQRGYFTGVFGYFDGKNLDSAVMIRYIEKIGDQLIYKSGGGITAMSDAKAEYQELSNKIYVPIN